MEHLTDKRVNVSKVAIMKKGHLICVSQLLCLSGIPVVTYDSAKLSTLVRPGSDNLLDSLIANWLIIKLALNDQSNALLLCHNIYTLIATSFCDPRIPTNTL